MWPQAAAGACAAACCRAHALTCLAVAQDGAIVALQSALHHVCGAFLLCVRVCGGVRIHSQLALRTGACCRRPLLHPWGAAAGRLRGQQPRNAKARARCRGTHLKNRVLRHVVQYAVEFELVRLRAAGPVWQSVAAGSSDSDGLATMASGGEGAGWARGGTAALDAAPWLRRRRGGAAAAAHMHAVGCHRAFTH